MAYGNKNKDDMGNKGRGGRGPKPMKGSKRSARKEKRAVRRVEKLMSDDMGNRGRGRKGPKPMKSNQLPESLKSELVKTTGEAMVKSLQKMVKPTVMKAPEVKPIPKYVRKKAGGMIKPEDPAPVTRYQGSTPKIGGNKKIEQISNEQRSYGQKRSEELRSAHEGYTGSTTDKGIEARYGKAAAQKKKS
jgi:hypothetical protein